MKKIIILLTALSIMSACKRTDSNSAVYPTSDDSTDTFCEDQGIFERTSYGLQIQDDTLTLKLNDIDTLFPEYECLVVFYYMDIDAPKMDEKHHTGIRLHKLKCDTTQHNIAIWGWNREWVFEEWNGGWVKKDPYMLIEETLCEINNPNPNIPDEQNKNYRDILFKIDSILCIELKKKTFYIDEKDWHFNKNLYSTSPRTYLEGRVRLR